MNSNIVTIGGSVSGKYTLSVIRNGEEIFPFGKEPLQNLVLNSGLDNILIFSGNSAINQSPSPLVGPFSQLMSYCRAGSSTTPAEVSQTGLISQLKSTSTYLSGSSYNGTTYDTILGTATHKRTYDFAAEVGPAAYNEIGIGPSASGTDMFSRMVLPSTVNCIAGDNLRVTYQMTVSIPMVVTPKAIAMSVSGWDATGSMKIIGTFQNIFGSIASTGANNFGGGFITLMNGRSQNVPSYGVITYRDCNLCTNSSFPSVNADSPFTLVTSGANVSTVSESAYTNGNFYRDSVYTLTASTPPATQSSNIKSIMWSCCTAYPSTYRAGIQLLLNNLQSKDNTKALSFTLRTTWSRA